MSSIDLDDVLKLQAEMAEWKRRAEAAEADKRRLDWLEAGRRGAWWNARGDCYVIQEDQQTVGNIGSGKSVRDAIDAAANLWKP